jgi:hypothetical protein
MTKKFKLTSETKIEFGVKLFRIKALLKEAGEAIRMVVEDDVQKTEGVLSRKNNKCVHGRYGYEGCDSCIAEFLSPTLTKLREQGAL